MIHSVLLVLHSLLRWILLLILIYAIYRSYKGWFSKSNYTVRESKITRVTTIIAHIQLLIGLILYGVSPVIHNLFEDFGEAVQQTSIRFYGMEHSIMMILAIVFITIGSVKSKREAEDIRKFKTVAIWFTIGLLLILAMTPWPFSPMDARPWFRIF